MNNEGEAVLRIWEAEYCTRNPPMNLSAFSRGVVEDTIRDNLGGHSEDQLAHFFVCFDDLTQAHVRTVLSGSPWPDAVPSKARRDAPPSEETRRAYAQDHRRRNTEPNVIR